MSLRREITSKFDLEPAGALPYSAGREYDGNEYAALPVSACATAGFAVRHYPHQLVSMTADHFLITWIHAGSCMRRRGQANAVRREDPMGLRRFGERHRGVDHRRHRAVRERRRQGRHPGLE
jgi:hypothetical protein